MEQNLSEWFNKEFNTFTLTDYSEKSYLSLLGSTVLAAGAFFIGAASAILALLVGLPLSMLSGDLFAYLLMSTFNCVAYDLKVIYEVLAKLIDFLGTPYSWYKGENFVLGQSLSAGKDAVMRFFTPTTSLPPTAPDGAKNAV